MYLSRMSDLVYFWMSDSSYCVIHSERVLHRSLWLVGKNPLNFLEEMICFSEATESALLKNKNCYIFQFNSSLIKVVSLSNFRFFTVWAKFQDVWFPQRRYNLKNSPYFLGWTERLIRATDHCQMNVESD